MSKAKKAKRNASAEENHIESLPADLDTMKRKDLQKLCKKHKLKAIGKVKILLSGFLLYLSRIAGILASVLDNSDNAVMSLLTY